MGFDKAAIIAETLDTEAAVVEVTVAANEKNAVLHEGARNAMVQIGDAIGARLVPLAEKLIEESDDLKGEGASAALRVVSQVTTVALRMCVDAAKNEGNEVKMAEGRAKMADILAKNLRQKAQSTLAVAARKLELAAETKANKKRRRPAKVKGRTNGKRDGAPE